MAVLDHDAAVDIADNGADAVDNRFRISAVFDIDTFNGEISDFRIMYYAE